MVREYKKKDIPFLKKLWQTVFEDDIEYIDRFFSFFDGKMRVFVSEEDSKIVSAVYCLNAVLVSGESRKNAWYLYAVSTLLKYRKRGHVTKIIEHIKTLDDFEYALFLTPSNEKNRQFYKKLGFEDRFYCCEIQYHRTDGPVSIQIKKRENENLYFLREKVLSGLNYVSWDKNHLEFWFDSNIYVVYKGNEAKGYVHIEEENGKIIADEVCVEECYLEQMLNKLCEITGKENINIFTFDSQNHCKKNKGMIYYKFDSLINCSTKCDYYLGVNLQ